MPEESRLPSTNIRREESGVITESGILFENGELLSTGEVAEIAIEAKRLYESGDEKAFAEFMYSPRVKRLSKDELYTLLWNSAITEQGAPIISVLMFID